jgi:hypothetical protein
MCKRRNWILDGGHWILQHGTQGNSLELEMKTWGVMERQMVFKGVRQGEVRHGSLLIEPWTMRLQTYRLGA